MTKLCHQNNHRFDRLELHCWLPYPAEAFVYDDDGTPRAYLKRENALTRLTIENEDSELNMLIYPVEDSFSGQPKTCYIELVLHHANQPEHIIVMADQPPSGNLTKPNYQSQSQSFTHSVQ